MAETTIQPDRVRKIAAHAIFDRLKYHAPQAIIAVFTAPARPSTLILHVNSGGNAAACEQALRRESYQVEWSRDYDPYAPGNYGVQLYVSRTGSQPEPEDETVVCNAWTEAGSECGREFPDELAWREHFEDEHIDGDGDYDDDDYEREERAAVFGHDPGEG